MPELPEVEVVRRGLAEHVVGCSIEAVEVLHPRPVRRHLPGAVHFAEVLTGRTLTGASRRGKYLWLGIDDHDALLVHLGMSGQMLIKHEPAGDERHLRVRFSLVAGRCAKGAELRFVDQRMFGGLQISEGGASLPPQIFHIARDPLDPDFDDELFVNKVRAKRSGIKRILLDQAVISGVGNIYADEALWAAQVHPERAGITLSRAQVVEVLAASRAVMAAALEQGGTSFDALYVNVNGQSGYFERSLRAYGQQGRPCPRCGTNIVRVHFMNRSSSYCPVCQRAPRGATRPVHT